MTGLARALVARLDDDVEGAERDRRAAHRLDRRDAPGNLVERLQTGAVGEPPAGGEGVGVVGWRGAGGERQR